MTRTFVSEDRCTMVQVFPNDRAGEIVMRVATRPDPDAVWGPPVQVTEER